MKRKRKTWAHKTRKHSRCWRTQNERARVLRCIEWESTRKRFLDFIAEAKKKSLTGTLTLGKYVAAVDVSPAGVCYSIFEKKPNGVIRFIESRFEAAS